MRRKLAAISLILTLFFQAMPVLHLFSDGASVFSTYVDEDKPDNEKNKEKKACKEFISSASFLIEQTGKKNQGDNFLIDALYKPYVESFIPPPDFSC
jgi:hypothetical protein